jgi:hypothetical protein
MLFNMNRCLESEEVMIRQHRCNADEIGDLLETVNFGEHTLILYSDVSAFTKVYSSYCQNHLLNDNDENILILTYFETPDKVRANLGKAGIDVRKYERDSQLTIMDGLKVYSNPNKTAFLLFNRAMNFANMKNKNGLTGFGDLSAFFHYEYPNRAIVAYEKLNPPIFEETMARFKPLCALHIGNYVRLGVSQQDALIGQHSHLFWVSSGSDLAGFGKPFSDTIA